MAIPHAPTASVTPPQQAHARGSVPFNTPPSALLTRTFSSCRRSSHEHHASAVHLRLRSTCTTDRCMTPPHDLVRSSSQTILRLGLLSWAVTNIPDISTCLCAMSCGAGRFLADSRDFQSSLMHAGAHCVPSCILRALSLTLACLCVFHQQGVSHSIVSTKPRF